MQARDSYFALGLVMTLSVFFATGCGKEYSCADSTNDSFAELAGAAGVDEFTGSGDASLFLASNEEVASGERCLQLGAFGSTKSGKSVSVDIELDCTAGTGTYELEDLNATACVTESAVYASDSVKKCGAILGTITVSAYTPSCGISGGCAHLHAKIVVAAGANADDGVALNGTVDLDYDETILECHEPLITYPGGD